MAHSVVCYFNQFFGQIGGEDKADIPPTVKEGAVGPALGLQQELGAEIEIVATVICGDSYFNEQIEEATAWVLSLISKYNPEAVIAGPAFNAGRYGMACGAVARAVSTNLDIPVVAGMYPENPGVELYRQHAYIVPTSNNAAGMRQAIPRMAGLVRKLILRESLATPEEEGYLARGYRVNQFTKQRGSRRAVEMLLKKLNNEPYITEYPMPSFDRVDPSPAIKDLKKATIALVTSGGIVPKGNPDHIESSSASKYGKYSLAGLSDLSEDDHETAHGGYDPVYANQDPNRILPLDILREYEVRGDIGRLHPYYYSTVGNGTSVSSAQQYAASIAAELKQEGVDGVIFTST